jgi:hypothetical protein
MIHYSYDYIEEISKQFSATLDEEVANRLLDIKKSNKFIRRKSTLRLKYKIHDSVAQAWRKEKEEKKFTSSLDQFKIELQANLNKLSSRNYEMILNKIWELYEQLSSEETHESFQMAIASMIFEKALTEKGYSYIYAQLLSTLYKKGGNDLKEICAELSEAFYQKSSEMRIEISTSDMTEAEIRNLNVSKMKFTGGFIFIANMFVYGMLEYDVVLKFYRNLIESFETAPLEYCDNYLDTVEQILNTAGYHLEKRASSREQFYEDFMDILNRYQNMRQDVNPRMSNKNRFKLMDITDLHKKNWNVREVVEEDSDGSFKKNKKDKKK